MDTRVPLQFFSLKNQLNEDSSVFFFKTQQLYDCGLNPQISRKEDIMSIILKTLLLFLPHVYSNSGLINLSVKLKV